MSDSIRVHAYTDEHGLTLFQLDWPDGRKMQFSAHITDFALETDYEEPFTLSDGPVFRRFEQRISMEAQVVGAPTVVNPQPGAAETDVRQVGPARKELE